MIESKPTQSLAVWSIPIAFAVLLLKLAAWWMTGSVAFLSDALETVVNVTAAILAWYAIRVAAIPSDVNHPFGHHKAEYLSAVTEGALIVFAAMLIFHQSISHLHSDGELRVSPLGLGLNAVAGIINGFWALILMRAGRRQRSSALIASGKHLYADVLTSVGVIAGVIVAALTGLTILDPLLAILVGLNILWEGLKVMRNSIDGLMDVAASPEELQKVERVVAQAASGALQIHDVRTRQAGPRLFIEFHLVVPGEMTVTESHDICDCIEAGLREHFPGAMTTIHVEPDEQVKSSGFEPDHPGDLASYGK